MSQAHFHDRASRAAALARRLGLPVAEPEAPDEDRLELRPPPAEEFGFNAAMSLLPDDADLAGEELPADHATAANPASDHLEAAPDAAPPAAPSSGSAGKTQAEIIAAEIARQLLAREQAVREQDEGRLAALAMLAEAQAVREEALQAELARAQAIREQLVQEQRAREQAARVEAYRAAELARIAAAEVDKAAAEAAKAATLSRDVAVLRNALAGKEADLSLLERERETLQAEVGKLADFADRVHARRERLQHAVIGLVAFAGLIAGAICTADYYMGRPMGKAPPLPPMADTRPVAMAPSRQAFGVVRDSGATVLRAPQFDALSIGRAEGGEKLAVHNVVTVALEQWVEVELHHQQGYIHRSDIELLP
jgi:hypothetical protein